MELDEAILAVREGDQAAFAAIIDQTERRLRAFLALQVPDRELIDEVAHVAYITAYEKLHDYKPGTNFFAWLKRIALNHLHNECRRRSHSAEGVEKLSLLIAPGPAALETEETRDRVAQLQRCMENSDRSARDARAALPECARAHPDRPATRKDRQLGANNADPPAPVADALHGGAPCQLKTNGRSTFWNCGKIFSRRSSMIAAPRNWSHGSRPIRRNSTPAAEKPR